METLALKEIMEAVENDDRSAFEITGLDTIYVGSKHHGMIEKWHKDGRCEVGVFKNNTFYADPALEYRKEKKV